MDGGSMRAADIAVPGKPGRGRPQPGWMPGADGDSGAGNGRARTGAVCAQDGLRSDGNGSQGSATRDGRSGKAANNTLRVY
jgi:hypothetical protein